ncbi:hypothetical protein A5643_16160 [Mycobacterium sp. 1274756.6]|nr:hypothetical protein A5643_16160 [Mycobacterium sp. 1274756.6]
MKRRFHRAWPDNLQPSIISRALAHGGSVVEFGVPLILLVSPGGPVTKIAAVSLEWNVFMIFSLLTLFWDKPDACSGRSTPPNAALTQNACSGHLDEMQYSQRRSASRPP